MHRIDVPSATADNLFTEGSPSGGVPATVVDADWLNDLQENVCKVVETAGVPLTKGRALDLTQAILSLSAGGYGSALSSPNGWFEVPYMSAGVRKTMLVQFGQGSTDADGVVKVNSTPIAFPNHFYRVVVSDGLGAVPGVEPVSAEPLTLGTFNAMRSGATGTKGFFYIAIGD